MFRYPEGPAHKAMRQALGKARFGFIESRKRIGEMILGEDFTAHGRTLFLAQGVFKREDGTETHRKTQGSRNALRTDRLRQRIHTPARIYSGNGKQSGTGKGRNMPRHTGSGYQNTAYPQYGNGTPEHFKSNQTDTIMTNREIIRELKRHGYSRVDIDTDSQPQRLSTPTMAGFINGTGNLSFHIVPPQDSFGLGQFAICATRNGESQPAQEQLCPVLFRRLLAFLKGERKENEIIDEICNDRKTE